jgi:BsuBI/PstI restriction endonuclease domain/BsuBI/PstI restriction endonuclease HTH domain
MRASIADQKIAESRTILEALGLPKEQHNDRAGLTLLALADLRPGIPWSSARDPTIGVTPIMDYVARHYRKKWKPNTRETVRRFTLHQFEQAGLVVANPDEPHRPTNSPKFCYQIERRALEVVRVFGTSAWTRLLRRYLADRPTLVAKYAQARQMHLVPVATATGVQVSLSPGGQSPLVKAIVEEFCQRFTPGATVAYVGDTSEKFAHFDRACLARIGVTIEEHGKMPDVVVHHATRNWLVLVEAVTSHGPVSGKRMAELKKIFSGSEAGLVFVTAFPNRKTLLKYLDQIAWETEVWVADAPDHLIHFNGERFLGPYQERP